MQSSVRYIESKFTAGRQALNYASGRRKGAPMLFLHGVTRNWRDFLSLMPAFEAQWQVLAPDMRGHGASDRASSQYRVVDYAADVAAFTQGLFARPGVVFGHSLGAMLACSVAAALPDRIQALVLEEPPFDTLGCKIADTPFAAYFAALRDLISLPHASVEQLAARLADVPMELPDGRGTVRLGDVRNAAALLHHAQSVFVLDPEALTPIVEGRWLEGFDWERLLARISCPVLLLKGETALGGMLPNDLTERVTAGLPDCTRIDFPDTGHHIHATHPEAVVECVNEFLARRVGGTTRRHDHEDR